MKDSTFILLTPSDATFEDYVLANVQTMLSSLKMG
jgi:hypothetical protein